MITHYDQSDDHISLPYEVDEPPEYNPGQPEEIKEFDPEKPF